MSWSPEPMRICVLEQQADAPAGLLADWAAARGHTVDVLRAPALEALPDPREHDAIVSLGSDRSVHASSDPWIARQVDHLRAAHEAGVPVLGLCFGGQALAAALGGRVGVAPCPEIGWYTLDGGDVVPDGPWFEWHTDAFAPPPGAEILARGPGGGVQAFRVGASVGLQFHPEADEAIIRGWIASGGAELRRNGLQAEEILRRTAALADEGRELGFALFDAVAERWPASRPSSVQT